MGKLIDGLTYVDLKTRRLTRDTCQRWGYGVSQYKGQPVQVAQYRATNGEVVGQKVRFPDKTFVVTGNLKPAGFFGQQLWKAGGSKRLIITEGEIDAMSVSQVQNHKWPVVSIPNGADSGAACVAAQLDWVEQFEQVVFMFDQDEPGRNAAEKCAMLITPGKAHIAELPAKDPNEMLQLKMTEDLVKAVFNARQFRPDGIVAATELTVNDLMAQATHGYSTQYPKMDKLSHGIRKGEMTLIAAGTGVGKTTLVRELGYHMLTAHDLKLGCVFLEENFRKTAQGFVAIHHGVPLGELRENPDRLTTEQYDEVLNDLLKKKAYFYDHFGSLESANLISKLNYLVLGLGVDFILLDHISMVVSGMTSSREGERKDIDILMTHLRALIERTGVGVIAVVHLKQPEGKAHEEGGRVTLSHLRGSGSLKQLPDLIIGLERNQQSEESDETKMRVLKNREFGDTGPAGLVAYDRKTGRLVPAEETFPEDETYDDNF